MAGTVTMSLTTLLVLAATSAGLEFTLARNKWNLPDTGSGCGVLLCQVNDGAPSEDKLQVITNMTVFRATPSGLGSIDDSRARQLRRIASVSSAQPKLEQVSDGMKVHGVLKDGQATLRVELSKQTDCMAEFTCQVRGVDSQGKELVISSSLIQQPGEVNTNVHDTRMPPSVFMQLFSLMQGLDVKLAFIEKNSERLEDKLNSMETKWESKFDDIKKEFTDKTNFLEHSLQDKLCQLDSKLSVIDSNAIQDKVLRTMKTQIDAYFMNVLNVSERTENTLNRTTTLLVHLNSNNTKFQNNVMENYQNLFENVTKDLSDVFTRTKSLTKTVENNLMSFKDDLDLSWQRLESKTTISALQTLNAVRGMASELNSSLVNSVESALTDFFMPESCKKNTTILLHPASTPYPVIYRSEFSGLDAPLLCDTITDGGGWIVIQRRTTGKVDFYRNWLSYRDGFGTLDSDFWLGNERIHTITSSGNYELRVDLEYQGLSKFALYGSFSIGGEDKKYELNVGAYSGTAGDSLTQHNLQWFSTYDNDNDRSSGNCAKDRTGAWWYHRCNNSNLNGKWQATSGKGLEWWSFTKGNSVSFSEMKIRRVD